MSARRIHYVDEGFWAKLKTPCGLALPAPGTTGGKYQRTGALPLRSSNMDHVTCKRCLAS